MGNVKIDDDIRQVLEGGRMDGDVYKLPLIQLERKLYEKVAKALKALGGKWTRKVEGFVFAKGDGDQIRGMIRGAVESGVAVDDKVTRQAFYTPDWVADIALAGIDWKAYITLEPSCGEGGLVHGLWRAGVGHVVAVDSDKPALDLMERTIPYRENLWCTAVHADFMTWKGRPQVVQYPRIAMNPPFAKFQWSKHTERAARMLSPDGAMMAILPDSRDAIEVRLVHPLIDEGIIESYSIEPLPENAFKESGTAVRTCVLRMFGPDYAPSPITRVRKRSLKA